MSDQGICVVGGSVSTVNVDCSVSIIGVDHIGVGAWFSVAIFVNKIGALF